jgi:hypothetical protein
MRVRRIGSLLAASMLVLALAPAASAAASPVEIQIHVDFEDGETFTASGFCDAGEAVTYNFMQAAFRGRATTYHLYKDLICEDGSGILTIRVEASAVFGFPGTIGGWNVVGGTGDYAGLRGGGSIVGIAFDGGLDDYYTGSFTS